MVQQRPIQPAFEPWRHLTPPDRGSTSRLQKGRESGRIIRDTDTDGRVVDRLPNETHAASSTRRQIGNGSG